MHLAIALFAVLFTTAPEPLDSSPDSSLSVSNSPAFVDSMAWQIYFGRNYVSHGDSIRFLAYTEQEYDARTKGIAENEKVTAERKDMAKFLADSLGYEVSIITLMFKNLSTRVDCRLLDTYTYGIRRDSLDFRAVSVPWDARVSPGKFDYIFVVFRKMEFRTTDYFYILFNGVDPFIRE